MEDLIRRKDAIDTLQKEINKGIPPFDDAMGSIRCGVILARNLIEDLASEQSEIIRCEYCKYAIRWRSKESARKFGQIYKCRRGILAVPKPDDFCSRGKRRTDE